MKINGYDKAMPGLTDREMNLKTLSTNNATSFYMFKAVYITIQSILSDNHKKCNQFHWVNFKSLYFQPLLITAITIVSIHSENVGTQSLGAEKFSLNVKKKQTEIRIRINILLSATEKKIRKIDISVGRWRVRKLRILWTRWHLYHTLPRKPPQCFYFIIAEMCVCRVNKY